MDSRCPVCGSAGTPERDYVAGAGHQLFTGRRVAVCTGCALRFCTPMPTTDELDAYYASGSYDAGERVAVQRVDPWSEVALRADAQTDLVTSVLGRPPRSWLDLGAAFGALLDEVARRGAVTAGVEPTPIRLDGLRDRGHRAWATDNEVEGTFEVVSFSHVLEHVNDPVGFIRDAAAKLDHGGVLFCEVPNVVPERPGRDEPHVLFFTEATLGSTFEAAGMTVRRIGETGWRQGKGLGRLHQLALRAKATGRVPTSLRRYDSGQRYGSGQKRAWLRCVASPS